MEFRTITEDQLLDQVDELSTDLTLLAHHFPGTTTTVAIALTPGGFLVGVGRCSAVSPERFDAEASAQAAKIDALNDASRTLWQLEAYAMRKR